MRIFIADDHPLYREAVHLRLARLFPDSDIAEAASMEELLALARRGTPDLVLVDLRMPGMTGAGDIARLCDAMAGAAVTLMSGSASADDVRLAVAAGAKGFLPKTLGPEPFAAAIAVLIAGGTYLPTEILTAPLTAVTAEPDLTQRERQVFVELASGATNKEIGRELGLAEITVKLHVRQILKKIGARNRSEAAVIAARRGLI